jgi:polysaccharide pyruvyl transferase WcaK-like protein
MLKDCDLFIIPGTGLLTDAFGFREWGPYNLFKWTSMAKLRRCKVLFVSVGVGPINTALGRYLVKSALSLAEFRSYRDGASLNYLAGIGFPTNSERVYPDLAFSLPKAMLSGDRSKGGRRSIVGIGLMEYLGKYSMEPPGSADTRPYLKKLVVFGEWLLKHEYDIRLLTGDLGDRQVTGEFRCLLRARLGADDEHRIVDNPISSVDELLSELAATDVVVATRFHNILLALLLNKPVISISFHHKCASLMEEMGLSEYCHDIHRMNPGKLIEQFQEVEGNAETLKAVIREKVEQSRKVLAEQYALIFRAV